MFRKFTKRLKIRWAAKTLAQLDDRTLGDIGIARSEIESVVIHGRSIAPRRIHFE